MRIAIIGAGAAGLTAAHELMQLGYQNITVYERNSRIGGKVFSYRSGPVPLELGAFWAGIDYSTVIDLAKFYGVDFIQENAELLVRSGDQTFPLSESVRIEKHLATMPLAILHANWVALRFHRDLYKVGLNNLDPELFQNFASFAAKYKIEPIADAFRPFWIGCGYSDYATTPAIYVLRLMMPIFSRSLRNIVSYRSMSHFTDGIYRFPTGYVTIFERIAEQIADVRLNTAVSAVQRVQDGDSWRIRITAGGRVDEFDRLIVSADLRSTMWFMDLSLEERNLFSRIMSHQYNLYLVDAELAGEQRDKMLLFDEPSNEFKKPYLVAALSRQELKPTWVVAQLADQGTNASDASEKLLRDLERNNFVGARIKETVSWNYFPRVSSADLADGFYDKLENIQGVRGTYFVGSIFNFETVESTASYARALVRRWWTH